VPLPEPAESAAGSVSASASVPLASRVMPPTDQALRPGGASPTPQPRVYGRAARPEPVDEPGQDDHQHDQGQQPRFDDHDRSPGAPRGFGEPPSVTSAPPVSPGMPPAFPPGVPSFMEPAGNNRPVNGVRPHSGADRPADPFGGPPDPFGGPPDPFGTPGGPAAGGAPVNGATPGYGPAAGYGPATPGYGPSPMGEQARGGFPPAFPQAGQQSGTSWDAQPEQGRFDSFKPDAEPKVEQPAPKVRNGRVLAAVLVTAVLILAIPLGLLSLLGKFGGNHKPAAFDPAVGSCVRQSGAGAVAANCGEAGAFSVVSKVDAREKCADPAQPAVVLQGDLANRVLCLKPAGQ
jgi:hypothetical protein